MHELSICIKHNFEDDMALPALRMLFVHSIQYASMIALAYTCYTIFLSLSLSLSYNHAVDLNFGDVLILTANVYFPVLRAFSSIISVLWLQPYCTESVLWILQAAVHGEVVLQQWMCGPLESCC